MDEDFDPTPTLEERVKELEDLYETLGQIFDKAMDTFEETLESNTELQNSTRKLCRDVVELINAVRAGKPTP